MVQLQIFTKSDYLHKLISLIIIRNIILGFSFFFILLNLKNLISEISGRLLIGQNDSLSVLLLVDICIEYKKGLNDLRANLPIGY